MAQEQLISIGFGKETFSSTSASLSAFVVEVPFTRTLPSKKYTRQGQCQKFAVSEHPMVNGYMYMDSIAGVPEGTVVLLQASHRHRACPLRDGAMFIATRATGPLLGVWARLPSAVEATLAREFLVFQGRGDILTLQEVQDRGIAPPKNYKNGFMDPEEIEECYRIEVIAPPLEEKPRYERVQGREGESVVVRARPGRKLSLRRPG